MTPGVRAVIVIAILAAGCVPTTTRPELPTWCPSGDCPGVPADPPRTGTIHATGECIWMTIDGERAAILWPPHYTATFAPALTVFDDVGHEVAAAGSALTTVMLGPRSIDQDSCGLTKVVELYFDKFATATALD